MYRAKGKGLPKEWRGLCKEGGIVVRGLRLKRQKRKWEGMDQVKKGRWGLGDDVLQDEKGS